MSTLIYFLHPNTRHNGMLQTPHSIHLLHGLTTSTGTAPAHRIFRGVCEVSRFARTVPQRPARVQFARAHETSRGGTDGAGEIKKYSKLKVLTNERAGTPFTALDDFTYLLLDSDQDQKRLS